MYLSSNGPPPSENAAHEVRDGPGLQNQIILYVNRDYPNQPAPQCRLIRVIPVHIQNHVQADQSQLYSHIESFDSVECINRRKSLMTLTCIMI